MPGGKCVLYCVSSVFAKRCDSVWFVSPIGDERSMCFIFHESGWCWEVNVFVVVASV